MKHFDDAERRCFDYGCTVDCPVANATRKPKRPHANPVPKTIIPELLGILLVLIPLTIYARATRPTPYVGYNVLEWTGCGYRGQPCQASFRVIPDGSYRSLACSDTGYCGLHTFVYWDEDHYRGPAYDPRYILRKKS